MGCCLGCCDEEQEDQHYKNQSREETRNHNSSELPVRSIGAGNTNFQDQQSYFRPQKSSIQLKYTPNDEESNNVRRIINEIYNLTCRKRNTEGVYSQFVRQKEDFQGLCNNYSFKTSTVKSQLKKICTSYRPARGDGNCFYTAFGYRFLEILLLQYDKGQFDAFFKLAEKTSFKINLQGLKIDDQLTENQLRKVFLYRLEQLRNIENLEQREEQLYQQFSASEQIDDNIDGCFYGLSTIFFRNLSYQIVLQSEMRQAVYDIENLLLWETECNSNEVVISALAQYLKIHIQLLYIEYNEFQLREYSSEYKDKIILLIRPGHYNMGYF